MDLFEFSTIFLNVIHFGPFKFSPKFRKLFVVLLFIFCLVNWTYKPREIEQNVWFCRFFLNFPLLFGAIHYRLRKFSLNFRKLFILLIFIFYLIYWTYVCGTENQTKRVFLLIILNFPLLFRTLFSFSLVNYHQISQKFYIT